MFKFSLLISIFFVLFCSSAVIAVEKKTSLRVTAKATLTSVYGPADGQYYDGLQTYTLLKSFPLARTTATDALTECKSICLRKYMI